MVCITGVEDVCVVEPFAASVAETAEDEYPPSDHGRSVAAALPRRSTAHEWRDPVHLVYTSAHENSKVRQSRWVQSRVAMAGGCTSVEDMHVVETHVGACVAAKDVDLAAHHGGRVAIPPTRCLAGDVRLRPSILDFSFCITAENRQKVRLEGLGREW